MSYANSIRFPFRVLIADGGADPSVTSIFSDKRSFPNVDFEYVRYPYDASYLHYYSKIADALAHVQTPFVAMADNDDFFIVEGLRLAVEFLRENPSYSACGGHAATLWITPFDGSDSNVYGKLVESKWRVCPPSVCEETAAGRIRSLFRNYFDASYYDVQRSEQARKRFEKLRDLELKDLFLAEYLIAFLIGVAGKVHRVDRLFLVRQRDSPQGTGEAHRQKFGDLFGRMLIETWSEDFTKVVTAVAEAISATDDMSIEDARKHVRQCYREFVAPVVIQNLLKEVTVKKTMPLLMSIVQDIVRLGPQSRIRRLTQLLYRRVPWISMAASNGDELIVLPLATYKEDFQSIAEFVTHKTAQ
jgi:glycosyltransferase domain-containing protein